MLQAQGVWAALNQVATVILPNIIAYLAFYILP